MAKPPHVVVEWVDARNILEQDLTREQALDKAKLAHRSTTGFLLHEDTERTVLSADYDPPQPSQDEENFGNLTVIPTGWVKAVHYLHRKRARKAKDGTVEPNKA